MVGGERRLEELGIGGLGAERQFDGGRHRYTRRSKRTV
jgi:hypothetical protein